MAEQFRIQTMNHIAERGIELLQERGCMVGEEVSDPGSGSAFFGIYPDR